MSGILDFISKSMFLTPGVAMILQILIAVIAGWISRHDYLLERKAA